MPILYNHTSKPIKIKFGFETEWLEIPAEAEFEIPDNYAYVFFGYGLETEAQLKECYNRLRTLGNELSYEDFLKIHDSITTATVVKYGKKKGIE
jgi:hypothetical protein